MIVNSALLIPCGEAPVLLQPVDHTLHPFSGAGDRSVTWPFLALVALPWDGHPDAMLLAILPDLPPAVPLVAPDAVGPALGAPSARRLASPGGHRVGNEGGLLPVARRRAG